MLRRALAALLFLCISAAFGAESGLVPIPTLTARVTDLTGTLSTAQRDALEQKLAAFEQQKGSQIAVLIVPTTQPEEIEQFSIRVVDAWKLGRKKVDDGVLLIIAKNDRRLRIEVGRGLEGVVPDAVAKRVIAETITPYFRNGDFNAGVEAGVTQLMALLQGEILPPPTAQSGGDDEGVAKLFGPFILFWFLGNLLRRGIGTFPAATLVGVATGLAASFFFGSIFFAVGLGLIAVLVALVLYSGGAGGGYYGGGGGFGRGGSMGGGGGFSGGGASGRW